MNILMYCQYLFGVGHLVRTMTIAHELAHSNNVVLMYSGRFVDGFPITPGMKVVWMDRACDIPEDHDPNLIAKKMRKIIDRVRPDIFWIEAYPFARRRFRIPIVSSIDHVRQHFPACRVCSSVRDVLLKYGGEDRYRESVISELNEHFDLLFVHSDPRIIPFELTFGPTDGLDIPMIYTGFVGRKGRFKYNNTLWKDGGEMVISYGGSNVGRKILDVAIPCHSTYFSNRKMHIYRPPYTYDGTSTRQVADHPNVVFHDFSWDYVDRLSSSALLINMGGYNSVTESLVSGVPTILVLLDTNDEQSIRAEHLRKYGRFETLKLNDLNVDSLKNAINRLMASSHAGPSLEINGAEFIRRYMSEMK